MKRKIVIAVLLLMAVLMSACGGSTENINKAVLGSWAYNHETGVEVAKFEENGTAHYNGEKYTFYTDDSFIVLKDKAGNETKLRYVITDKGMDLYRIQKYDRADESTGLTGYWIDMVNTWTFEFTDKGTFREDGSFTGYYAAGEDGSLKLMYEQQFSDTYCYYTLDGNKLTVEYPWPMVKTTK